MIKCGLIKDVEFCYGSRNIQLQTGGKVYYDKNVYAQIAEKHNLKNVLTVGESLYGEILGQGIQKGYHYGIKQDEYAFLAYDVKVDDKYLDSVNFKEWCDTREIPRVPVLYEGPMSGANINELKSGPSVFAPEYQPVREGVVVKPQVEQKCFMGRKILKMINDDYLLNPENTDFH